jgi:transcriptional regulator with XRE-family HTH domain
VITELREKIEGYLQGGKHRTLTELAGKSGVSYSTLRRIAQGECKSVELSSAVGLLRVVASWEETLHFLDKYFPESGKHFRATTAPYTSDFATEELERSLLSFEKFVAISMASTPRGTTEAEVVAAVGHHAKARLEELLDRGVLEVRNGRLFTREKGFASIDLEKVVVQLSHCLRLIRPENTGKRKQIAALHSNGVSRAGQLAVHELFASTLAKADEIVTANPGGTPIFFGVALGEFAGGEL